jgi:hypothetical protein
LKAPNNKQIKMIIINGSFTSPLLSLTNTYNVTPTHEIQQSKKEAMEREGVSIKDHTAHTNAQNIGNPKGKCNAMNSLMLFRSI